ncbi:MAG: type ISP restriction/modification enzyme [bacterium]
MLKTYLKQIADTGDRGDAREESYYSALESLLKEYCNSVDKHYAYITTLPKKTEAGNPDFRVWDGKQHITGYIEAKAPTFDDLDIIQDTEQLKRYRHTFPNLILTNFLEFRLYRDGELIDKVLIGRPVILNKLKTMPPIEKESELLQLFERFFSFSIPKVSDARTLAIELAKRTRFLKDEVIAQELREEGQTGKGFISGFYKAFKDYLISSLTEDEFADLYAQTITYGLFAARTRSKNEFKRKDAFYNIPQTIGILRDVFRFISLEDIPQQMEWIIDDIAEILSVTDTNEILHKYFHEGRGKDPIVHFYETFLAEYDPETREMRGVYYTPEPVVSYIVRSLHSVLKEEFKRPDGFASNSVTVLDPAAGTLTFLAEVAKLAVNEFVSKYGEGGKEDFIKNHILKDFYAFELMMAPYAVGHLKMSFLLEELGYRLQRDDRVKLYLTNTLEMEELKQISLPGMSSLSEESHLAGKVKKEQPILVILGNPPYSGHSTNIGEWISKEIRAYYQVDGKPLNEKNPKWLQDDYVKFIRFAQWKIDQVGEGVLGFITNHSYLDNPTFRGMRQSLMNSFNEIYLLDLHGNSKKKEKCPDGSKDENVFDIQQGVAIALFIKKKGVIVRSETTKQSQNRGIASLSHNDSKCKVSYSEIWGLREEKYDWLLKNDIKTTKWQEIKPKSEFYLFIPGDEKRSKQYQTYLKITDVFPVNSVGIVTARDGFVIDSDKKALMRRIMQLRDKSLHDDIIRQTYGLNDTSKFKLSDARSAIMKESDWDKFITKLLYRPFDEQWIFYHDALIERPRKEVMQHMMHENLGLITSRIIKGGQYCHTFVTKNITDAALLAANTASSSYLFPLYLYQKKDNPKKHRFSTIMMLFEPRTEYTARKPNLSPALLEELTRNFKRAPTPEQVFYYIYAILYSNIYRTRYAEFLKIDFPRIPFTKDYMLFKTMSEYGNKLVDLHLLKSSKLDQPVARFQGKGDNRVEKLRYDSKAELLYINDTQYFEGIKPEVFEYQIGGYQVCDKWLKDRKDRTLSLEEIQTYCRIATAIENTIKIQDRIDAVYQQTEKDTMRI